MKIKIKTLLATCKGEGYTGSETDPEAMKKHLIDAGIATINLNGSDVEVKALVVETKAAKKPVIADDDDDAPETKSAAPDDIDAKIAAAVQAATKAHRPTDGPVVRNDEPIGVKSVLQRVYEATPNRFFKSFQTAELFRDYLLSTGENHRDGRDEPAVKSAVKSFRPGGRWHKAYATTPDAAGGATIMEQFYPDFINNVNQYGVARKLCRMIPMTTDRLSRPVKTGIHTVYYPEENGAMTESNGITYRSETLQPKMGTVLVRASRQVIDDAAGSGIFLLEDTAREIARSFANIEDQALFTATGLAATGNMIGINGKFAAIGVGNAAGATVGGGTMSAHSLANVISFISKLPAYARNERTAYHCTPAAADLIFRRLSLGQGGVTYRETVDFGEVMYWQGRPVIVNNVMNETDAAAANTIDVLYGDISRGVDFGDRMSVQIDISDQVYWSSVGIGIRGIVRHDINVHDIGDTSRVGPIVALYQS